MYYPSARFAELKDVIHTHLFNTEVCKICEMLTRGHSCGCLELVGGDTYWPVRNWPVIFGLLFRCDVKFFVFQIKLTGHLEFQHF